MQHEFPPGTYLAAARIAYPLKGGLKWIIYFGQLHTKSKSGITREFFGPHENGNDYRALREALDKKYFVRIRWSHAENKWESECSALAPEYVFGFLEEDITILMLKNVEALIEAGVVE